MSINLDPKQREGRWGPGLFIVCTLAVLLSPAAENWKRKPVDSFPLSYFPMFSAKRSETYSAQTIYGVDGAGKTTVLPYRFAGTGGFNSVRRQLRVHVRESRAAVLCGDVAARVSRSRNREHAGIREIRIATQKHNVGDFFAGERTPLSEKVHAACAAPPRRAANKSADNQLTLEVEVKDQPWSSN